MSAALPTVPVQVFPSTDESDVIKMLILSNKDNRERTNEQKAREVQQLKLLYKGRKSVKIQEKEEKAQPEPFSSGTQDWADTVGAQLDISSATAKRLDYALTTAKSLTEKGKTQEAEEVRQALNTSANAGYQKACEYHPPKTQKSTIVTKSKKGTALQQEAMKRLGKHAPRRDHVRTYDIMVKLFDQLTKTERALFLDFVQLRINLRVSVPTPRMSEYQE